MASARVSVAPFQGASWAIASPGVARLTPLTPGLVV